MRIENGELNLKSLQLSLIFNHIHKLKIMMLKLHFFSILLPYRILLSNKQTESAVTRKVFFYAGVSLLD